MSWCLLNGLCCFYIVGLMNQTETRTSFVEFRGCQCIAFFSIHAVFIGFQFFFFRKSRVGHSGRWSSKSCSHCWFGGRQRGRLRWSWCWFIWVDCWRDFGCYESWLAEKSRRKLGAGQLRTYREKSTFKRVVQTPIELGDIFEVEPVEVSWQSLMPPLKNLACRNGGSV